MHGNATMHCNLHKFCNVRDHVKKRKSAARDKGFSFLLLHLFAFSLNVSMALASKITTCNNVVTLMLCLYFNYRQPNINTILFRAKRRQRRKERKEKKLKWNDNMPLLTTEMARTLSTGMNFFHIILKMCWTKCDVMYFVAFDEKTSDGNSNDTFSLECIKSQNILLTKKKKCEEKWIIFISNAIMFVEMFETVKSNRNMSCNM